MQIKTGNNKLDSMKKKGKHRKKNLKTPNQTGISAMKSKPQQPVEAKLLNFQAKLTNK